MTADGAVDLAAERAASRARRAPGEEMAVRRGRARMLLNGRWNATPNELREAIDEIYPRMDGERRKHLLADALEAQRIGRPKIDPSQIRVRAPEVEIPTRGNSRPRPAANLIPDFTIEEPEMIATATPMEPPRPVGPIDLRIASNEDRARLVDVVKAEIRSNPRVNSARIREAVETELRWTLTEKQARYALEKGLQGFGDREPPAPTHQEPADPMLAPVEPEAVEPEAPAPSAAAEDAPAGSADATAAPRRPLPSLIIETKTTSHGVASHTPLGAQIICWAVEAKLDGLTRSECREIEELIDALIARREVASV